MVMRGGRLSVAVRGPLVRRRWEGGEEKPGVRVLTGWIDGGVKVAGKGFCYANGQSLWNRSPFMSPQHRMSWFYYLVAFLWSCSCEDSGLRGGGGTELSSGWVRSRFHRTEERWIHDDLWPWTTYSSPTVRSNRTWAELKAHINIFQDHFYAFILFLMLLFSSKMHWQKKFCLYVVLSWGHLADHWVKRLRQVTWTLTVSLMVLKVFSGSKSIRSTGHIQHQSAVPH